MTTQTDKATAGKWVEITRITKKQIWVRDGQPKMDLLAVNKELLTGETTTFELKEIK